MWNRFLLKEIDEKRILPGVFKPVQHYLNHIPYIIRQQGVLKAYSGRSMERTIGLYKKLIKSKVSAGINAGNILNKSVLYNYIASLDIDIKKKISLLEPKPYNADTYISLDPDNLSSPQLWSTPLQKYSLSTLPCDVTSVQFKTALLKFYQRAKSQDCSSSSYEDVLIAGRCWYNNFVYSSLLYRNYKNERRRGNHYIMFNVLHQS
jgi:hypothetical protein